MASVALALVSMSLPKKTCTPGEGSRRSAATARERSKPSARTSDAMAIRAFSGRRRQRTQLRGRRHVVGGQVGFEARLGSILLAGKRGSGLCRQG